MIWDYLIVGAGFSGAVLAERLASQLGATCLVIDRRKHIAGNAFDGPDASGVLIHHYGPHYFRTNAQMVIDYLSQFTEWHHVDYKILSWTHGRYWQFPINLNTFEQLIGRRASSQQMEAVLEAWRVPIPTPRNSEEIILSQVGTKLYEMFFRGYTAKQWRLSPKDLDPSVCGRIPLRTNRDDRYLSERFQALPAHGYTAMFHRILNHPRIELRLGAEFREIREQISYRHLIYSGPIDEYFDFCFGRLPYRSLRFEPETYEMERYQPALQVNYPNEFEYTRTVELKHATGQKIPHTTVVREYPADFYPGSEPFYPIPAPDARRLYQQYAERAEQESNVTFLGRLATYRYLNMDQVVASALTTFHALKTARSTSSEERGIF